MEDLYQRSVKVIEEKGGFRERREEEKFTVFVFDNYRVSIPKPARKEQSAGNL